MTKLSIVRAHSSLLLGSLLSISLVGLSAPLSVASAQDNTIPTIKKLDVPRLKPGPVPRVPRKALDEFNKGKIGPVAQGKGVRPTSGRNKTSKSKLTPGKRAGTGSAAEEDKKLPKWRQPKEETEPDKPTLSADFIKNCARLRPGVTVHLDIYDEEMDAVVKLIACMTGKNIILAKPLKGKKITIYSPQLVTANEAYDAFVTALRANGFTIVKKGRFLEIIEIKNFGKEGPLGSQTPARDQMETHIIMLKAVDAQEISEVISKFATSDAQIVVYAPSNILIITETRENLKKLRKLIRRFDQPGGQDQLWTYQVVHAEAADIASKITEVYEKESSSKKKTTRAKPKRSSKKGSKSTTDSSSVGESELDVNVTKVIADERTNRLLIVATARSYRRIKSLIAKLDVAIPGDGQVHIHQLNHAKAVDLSTVLSNLSQEAKNRANNSGNRRTAKSKSKSKAPVGASSAALFEGEVSVTADEDTNSLVITASLKDYHGLKKVIDVLDRPRRQVFIEAVIMEVSITNARGFGISLHGGTQTTVAGEDVPLVFSNQVDVNGGSPRSFDVTSAVGLTGLAAAAQSGTSIDIGGGLEIPSFGVILSALAKSSDVNILSTPHILTTDNEEAEIVVGSNVPFVAGVVGGGGLGGGAGGLGGNFFPTVNVQRQDVALTLKITPRINAANFVTMEIDQVIEEISASDPQLGPTTSKRSIKSTVVVGDQRTVVIGGLQRTRQAKSKSGIPLLGEIPVLGYFFRSNADEAERLNLLLMLTPYVIETPADFRAIFKRKMDEHREFSARFHQDGDEIQLGIDYGKKSGVVEAINKSLREARDEQQLLEQLRLQEQGPPLPQDLDGVPIDPVARGRADNSGESEIQDLRGDPSPMPVPIDPVPADEDSPAAGDTL